MKTQSEHEQENIMGAHAVSGKFGHNQRADRRFRTLQALSAKLQTKDFNAHDLEVEVLRIIQREGVVSHHEASFILANSINLSDEMVERVNKRFNLIQE